MKRKIWNCLIDAGLTEAGAAGLMGNLQAESGLIPNKVETLCLKRLAEVGKTYTDATYTALVDDGTISMDEFLHPLPYKVYGYGLAQWTNPDRKAGLYTLAKARKTSIGDLGTQLEWLVSELKMGYRSVWRMLSTTDKLYDATVTVLTEFEAPADTGLNVRTQRYLAAISIRDEMIKEADSMHYISNCGHDENGSYAGGISGDQTGTEWELIPWYSRPWNCVLRHPDKAVRDLLAELGEKAAKNNHVGYDQYQRDTYWTQLQAAAYDPARITKNCETDCSKGIIDHVRAAGYLLGRDTLKNVSATYTGNMRAGFKAAGFTVLTDAKYLTSPDYLLPGDILLNDQYHTATNISEGSRAVAEPSTPSTGASSSGIVGTCSVTLKQFLQGARDPQVKTIQIILNGLGYRGKDGAALTVDGDLGPNTAYAIERFQRDKGMKDINFGSVAGTTWKYLLNA